MLVQVIFCIQHFTANAVNTKLSMEAAYILIYFSFSPLLIINGSIFRGGTLLYALVEGQVTFPRWSVFLNT